jgi:hypothetical protein
MAYSKAKFKSNGDKASPCFLQRCESVTCSMHGRNWFGHNGKCVDTRLTGLFEEYHSTVALFTGSSRLMYMAVVVVAVVVILV